MKKYLRKYMLYVVALLIVVVVVYGLVDRMVVDTITVSYDGKSIELHELEVDSLKPFESVVNQMSTIPYLPLNSELMLDFNQLNVISFDVSDYILTSSGDIRYRSLDSSENSISIHAVDNTYYLTLKENMSIYLSSAIEEKIYRGIEIVISTEEKTTSYLCVVETDAFEE